MSATIDYNRTAVEKQQVKENTLQSTETKRIWGGERTEIDLCKEGSGLSRSLVCILLVDRNGEYTVGAGGCVIHARRPHRPVFHALHLELLQPLMGLCYHLLEPLDMHAHDLERGRGAGEEEGWESIEREREMWV